MYIRNLIKLLFSKLVLQIISTILIASLLGAPSCNNSTLGDDDLAEDEIPEDDGEAANKSKPTSSTNQSPQNISRPTGGEPTNPPASTHAPMHASQAPDGESVVLSPTAASPQAKPGDDHQGSPTAASPHATLGYNQGEVSTGGQAASAHPTPSSDQGEVSTGGQAVSAHPTPSSDQGEVSPGRQAASAHATPSSDQGEVSPGPQSTSSHAAASGDYQGEFPPGSQSPPTQANSSTEPPAATADCAVAVDGIINIKVEKGRCENDIRIIANNIAGTNVPKQDLNQYTLSYEVETTDAINPVAIVVQRATTNADMNASLLGNVLIASGVKSFTQKNHKPSGWKLSPSDATHITIRFFVHKGDTKTQIGTLYWRKADKPKASTKTRKEANEHQTGSESNTDMALGNMKCNVIVKPSHKTPKKFDIIFTSTAEQEIPPKELAKIKFSYTITGEGNSNMRLIRGGSNKVGNNKTLKDILKATLKANQPLRAQFTLQPGKATKVTIQFFLEQDSNKINIGEYVWKQ